MMTIQNGVKEVSCAALLQTIVPTSCPTVVEHDDFNIFQDHARQQWDNSKGQSFVAMPRNSPL